MQDGHNTMQWSVEKSHIRAKEHSNVAQFLNAASQNFNNTPACAQHMVRMVNRTRHCRVLQTILTTSIQVLVQPKHAY